MRFKGKKGMIAILLLAILFWVVTATLFVKLEAKKTQFNATIGETQIELMRGYTKGEELLFYVDQAAKYSSYRAVYDLGLNGGFFNYKCGSYKGYGLWQDETHNLEYCSPDYKNNLGKFLSSRLESYFKDEIFNVSLPTDNYDIVFKENEKLKVYGIATMPLPINLFCGKGKSKCGIYQIKPSFTDEIDYNFKDYEIIKEVLGKIEDNCKKEQDFIGNKELENCINKKMGDYKGLEWKRMLKEEPIKGQEDRNFIFEVKSSKKMPFRESPITYKFAFFVSDAAAPPLVENAKIEKQNDKIKISWEENKALDVVRYNIYYNDNENIFNPSNVFDTINRLIKIEVPQTQISHEIPIQDGKIYYFAVTAVDEAGNEIKEGVKSIEYP